MVAERNFHYTRYRGKTTDFKFARGCSVSVYVQRDFRRGRELIFAVAFWELFWFDMLGCAKNLYYHKIRFRDICLPVCDDIHT